LVVFAILISPSAMAAPARPAQTLDPNVIRAIEVGLVGPLRPVRPGPAHVVIELLARATDASLAALEAAGALPVRVQGRWLTHGRFVSAILPTSKAARAVAALPDVVRVSMPPPAGPLPLDRSATLLRLADARGARPALDLLTGKGILIGDVDSLVDPFHPTFFKGDGGYFDWIDVNGDGAFTPGTDAIDLDHDGAPSPAEVAQVLSATTIGRNAMPVAARPAGFDPGIDWLYLDTNGNGVRDYGAAAGFTDATYAFGEPLFVPDDVNRSGSLDPGERVVRLGTSKFRSVFVNLGTPYDISQVFDRGNNLSSIQTDYTGGQAFGFPDALHATGVSTILVGDVPLVGRRWVGIAPDAEVVTAFSEEQGLPVEGTMWTLEQKPDVMLYELAVWAGDVLDGSDALSQIIDDSATSDSIAHTCPTGDQGSARKHAHADVAANQTSELAFDLPAMAKGGTQPLTYVDISLNVRGGAPTTVTLHSPSGTTNAIGTAGVVYFGTTGCYITHRVSPRGTWFTDMVLYTASGGAPLEVGTWTVSVGGTTHPALSVDAYVQDDKSSWTVGAAFDAAIATDRSTIGIPSTADHCIAVNAVPDHLASPSEPWYDYSYSRWDVPMGYADRDGQLRAYNPLGPRIDGVIKPDVAAPDNPWVATEHSPMAKTPYGSFWIFGGTSGASPHVTGVAALLAQAGIRGDAARDAIRAGAVHDAITGPVPNPDYGYGRLDAAGTLGVTDSGTDPVVTIAVKPMKPTVGGKITLTPMLGDGSTDGIDARWDDDYDGTWDGDYAPVAPRVLTFTMPGLHVYKLRVRNSAGHIAEAIVRLDVGPAPPGCSVSPSAQRRDGTFALMMFFAVLALWRRCHAGRFGNGTSMRTSRL
jgi:hypothetical protein